MTLASAIETGADRALRQSAKRTDTDAVMYLHSTEQKRKETEQADKTAADQFIQAASLKPSQQGEMQKRQNETDGFLRSQK